MAIQRKANTSPAFRYFIFIVCLCIFLFAFLLTRLIAGPGTTIFNSVNNKYKSFRVEVAPPDTFNGTYLKQPLREATPLIGAISTDRPPYVGDGAIRALKPAASSHLLIPAQDAGHAFQPHPLSGAGN